MPAREADATEGYARVSPLLVRHASALAESAALGPVADLACGRGRVALAVAAGGVHVIAIDRDRARLAELREAARVRALPAICVRSDLESGYGLPLAPGRCGAITVFRYLHRPLCAEIAAALAPGGLLLYETFTIGQRALAGGPKRAEFLLAHDELPTLFPELECLEYTEVRDDERALGQLAARRPA